VCTDLATTVREFRADDAGAVMSLVTACELGHLQACRRIAVLPEDRAGLRPECTLHPDERCAIIEEDPVQLAHFAACRTAQWEVPGLIVDDAYRTSRAFEDAGIAL